MKSFCAHGPDRPGRSGVGSTRPANRSGRRSRRERTPIIPGGHIATLVGDSPMPEIIIQRLNFPNHTVAPHIHTYTEVATVLSGTLGFGEGEKFDPSKGVILKAGSELRSNLVSSILFGRRAKRRSSRSFSPDHRYSAIRTRPTTGISTH